MIQTAAQKELPAVPPQTTSCVETAVAHVDATHRHPTERVLSKVREAIDQSSYRELNRLTVTPVDGGILLEGRVSCYFLKQMAQEVVRKPLEGHRVVNRVTVTPSPK
ncbi:MAG TPA: hypothetical protein DDW52_19355 [Planctomycetaceae bacterium]|nr:hypothetical protein [Planctomycetaceae bacterium]